MVSVYKAEVSDYQDPNTYKLEMKNDYQVDFSGLSKDKFKITKLPSSF